MTGRIGALFVIAVTAAAQQTPPAPTFRAGTDLVQVSVVAQDKDGKPVADLRREDFQIFDNGAQQEIRLFLADKPNPARDAARSAGVFTNRIATEAGAGYSVLLFDNLNIDIGQDAVTYTARAREKALRALQAIPPGDKIAIYALWCQFQVFREFTSDRDSLSRQLGRFTLAPANCVYSEGEPRHALTERMFNPGYATVGVPDSMAAIVNQTQVDIADREMKQLAEHLAGIPGRKNLIWLTSTFRVKPGNLQKLLNANVAVHPVDAVGSTIGVPAEKQLRYAPIRALAAITGGKAYVDRDDLDIAIGDALNDGRLSYTLGFYRPDPDKNTSVHQIGVRVGRPGVTLRYRTSYTVEPTPPKSANPVRDLVDAMDRPADPTAIGMAVSATRRQNQLELSIDLDISGLDLEQSDGLRRGKAELVTRFMTADGKLAGKVVAQTLTFNLRPATYAAALQRGFRVRREMPIPPRALDLNLLIGNLASGKIGTLTIPLSEVRE